MGFNDFLKSLFGNKSQRDLKEILPYVNKVKEAYPAIEKLSDDELRARIDDVKKRVQDAVAPEKNRIAELRASVEEQDYEKREAIWEEIDKIEKTILEKYEKVLDEVLPEVFAVVKDTARRFAQNETITVTATPFDRELALTHDFVHIEGDKAIYQNHWVAGGNEVTWDMIHYDVQLFGGVVLHKGKIAEMATGEGKTLVATLPVFLNALTGNGVHVVMIILPNVTRNGWARYICFMVCLSIVSTSTSPILKNDAKRIMRILLSELIMSSVSIICVIICRHLPRILYSVNITMRLSMRWTPY